MSPYIETIKLLNGELKNLRYHQERFERTRSLALGLKKHPELGHIIQIPGGLDRGLYKCRVVYGKEIERFEFEPQIRRVVRSLKVVHSDTISYNYKSADRSALDALYQLRGTCDDILIVKNGFVTDSYYANTLFWDGHGWFTPHHPLLAGTMRAYLLDKKAIEMRHISIEDLDNYQKIRLINAMNGISDGPEISVDAVMC